MQNSSLKCCIDLCNVDSLCYQNTFDFFLLCCVEIVLKAQMYYISIWIHILHMLCM